MMALKTAAKTWVRDTVRNRTEGKHGNLSAVWVNDRTFGIKSYNTFVAWWNESQGWTFTTTRYSVTTTNHVNVISLYATNPDYDFVG
jgi:hypothetical protein